MDNKNKQNFSRQANTKACQSTESNRKSTTDLQSNKALPRNSHRRENNNSTAFKNDQQRNSKQLLSAKVRTNVDKRPRPRGYGAAGGTFSYNAIGSATTETNDDDFSSAPGTGLALLETTSSLGDAVANDGVCGALDNNRHLEYELNSVYTPGSKKHNLNHLINFHYASRESDNSMGISVFGRKGGGGSSKNGNRHGYGITSGSFKKHKYNKEQFMQANFQFVIKSSAKPKFNSSPDTLIDWNLIEQINIQTTEEPQCPICLYPPIAAKLTRCGHAYCWPCILHYLALTEKTWRKCPICYEAIHIADLKSTTIVQQQHVKVGDKITFHLMRRKKGSMFIEKYTSSAPTIERYPLCSINGDTKLFSKFLIAKHSDILDIISREHHELTTGTDETCPEFVFIQQALDLLKERRENLPEIVEIKELNEDQELKAAGSLLDVVQNSLLKELDKSEMENEEAAAGIIESPTSSVSSSEDHNDDLCRALPAATTKYYYFYQSVDGQNIYLHPLNVKMLQACYGTLEHAPLIINARILQKEYQSMDEDHRRKFTCLGHLPLTCQFAVVEVDLQPPLIEESILKLFKDDILYRKKERQQRDRDERKREKKINEINDRQMGKIIASTVNLNLGSSYEFPTFGFEEPLVGSNVQEIATSPSIAISTPNRNVSYSTVAVGESPKVALWPTLASPTTNSYNSYQELSTWGKPATTPANRKAASDRNSDCDSLNEKSVDLDADELLMPMHTNLGDVLAEALSQKKQVAVEKTNAGGGVGGKNKKTKKSKKMLPLFSTGMSFNSK